jgi:hypothetical protein
VVSEVTLKVGLALFLMSCVNVVLSFVAATARLSRYPSNRASVSNEIILSAVVLSLAVVTALAAPIVGVAFPAANN